MEFFNPEVLEEQEAASSQQNGNAGDGQQQHQQQGAGDAGDGNQQQQGAGDGTQQQQGAGDGTQQQGAGDGTQQQGDGTQQQQQGAGDGTQQQGAGDGTQQQQQGQPAATPDDLVKKAQSDLLKRYNVNSLEELDAKLNPKTAEQIAAEKETHKAALNKYVVDKKYFTTADLVKLENLKSANPVDLVYEKFAASFKETNKTKLNDLQEEVPITDEDVKSAFNTAYHINSENPALKKVGESMIATEAKSLVSEIEDKYNRADEEFKDFSFRKVKSQEYFGFLDGFIDENFPKEFTYGTGDDKVTFQFDKEKFTAKDKEELKKNVFVNDSDFEFFIENGKSQKLQTGFQQKMQNYLRLTYHDKIVETIGQIKYEAGVKAGSTTGAKAPFVEQKQEIKPVDVANNLTDAELADLKDTMGGF